jgi:VanZ family protein
MSGLFDWFTKRSHWKILTRSLVAGILVCTMWPFNPLGRNHVQWIPGDRGIVFNGKGIAWTPSAVQTKDARGNAVSLEVLMRTPNTYGVHTILNIYAPGNPNQFLFRQWTDGLIVSHSWLVGSRMRSAKFDVGHVFQPGKLILVTLTADGRQTTAYLNGKLVVSFAHFAMSIQDLSGQIVVGNPASGFESWTGELRGLAMYSRALSTEEVEKHYEDWLGSGTDVDGAYVHYNFADGNGKAVTDLGTSGEPLEIPATFRIPHKTFLKPIREEWRTPNYFWDVIVNIIGFAPFGIALGGYLRFRRGAFASVVLATVAGGVFSFLIETTQWLIPTRASGQTDIVTNTTGAMLGAIVVSVWFSRYVTKAKEKFEAERRVA